MSACDSLEVFAKHANSWAPLHTKGITISAGKIQESILNTLFKRKWEPGDSKWTQSHSCCRQFFKGKLVACIWLEVNFDVHLKFNREYSFSISNKKHQLGLARWGWVAGMEVANHQYSWRFESRAPMPLETVELITAHHSERNTFTKSMLNACRFIGVPQLRHASLRNWIIRECMFN